MSITIRVTLPDLDPAPEVTRLLRALVPVAAPALLSALDASGMSLPARLLLHSAVGAAQRAAEEPCECGRRRAADGGRAK